MGWGGGLTLALLTKKGGGLGLWTSPRPALDLPYVNSAIIFPFHLDKTSSCGNRFKTCASTEFSHHYKRVF